MRYLTSNGQHSDQPFDSSKASQSDWSFAIEPVGISKSDAFTKSGLLEQINTTADVSDYLWYSIRCGEYLSNTVSGVSLCGYASDPLSFLFMVSLLFLQHCDQG